MDSCIFHSSMLSAVQKKEEHDKQDKEYVLYIHTPYYPLYYYPAK